MVYALSCCVSCLYVSASISWFDVCILKNSRDKCKVLFLFTLPSSIDLSLYGCTFVGVGESVRAPTWYTRFSSTSTTISFFIACSSYTTPKYSGDPPDDLTSCSITLCLRGGFDWSVILCKLSRSLCDLISLCIFSSICFYIIAARCLWSKWLDDLDEARVEWIGFKFLLEAIVYFESIRLSLLFIFGFSSIEMNLFLKKT